MFFGKLDQLFFDPEQRQWLEVTPFLAYSAKLGRKWITIQETLKKSIPDKYGNKFAPSTSPSRNIIWRKQKA
jgi:hypothetical protein